MCYCELAQGEGPIKRFTSRKIPQATQQKHGQEQEQGAWRPLGVGQPSTRAELQPASSRQAPQCLTTLQPLARCQGSCTSGDGGQGQGPARRGTPQVSGCRTAASVQACQGTRSKLHLHGSHMCSSRVP